MRRLIRRTSSANAPRCTVGGRAALQAGGRALSQCPQSRYSPCLSHRLSFPNALAQVVAASHLRCYAPYAAAVVEVYQAWCGPSKAVQSTFKKILLDSPDAAIQFFTVCAAKVPALEKYDHCEPKFLLVKVCSSPPQKEPAGNSAPQRFVRTQVITHVHQRRRQQHQGRYSWSGKASSSFRRPTSPPGPLCWLLRRPPLAQDSKAVEEVVGLQLPKLTRLIQQLSTGGGALAQRHSSTEE